MAHDHSQTVPVSFSINGNRIETDVPTNHLLLDFVREELGLTGAKRSCDMQICGTCTLLLDGEPISSCTTLAYEVDGRDVQTVEGLAGDESLHPVQQSFIDHGALQCGFCTPGMILAAKALLEEQPSANRDEIVEYMNGNICRCTGYVKIIEAIETVAESSTLPSSEESS